MLNDKPKWKLVSWAGLGGAFGMFTCVGNGIREFGLSRPDSLAKIAGSGLAGLFIGLALGWIVGEIVKMFMTNRN
jgi:hypothetical protein